MDKICKIYKNRRKKTIILIIMDSMGISMCIGTSILDEGLVITPNPLSSNTHHKCG